MKNIGMKSMLERTWNVPGTYWERTRNVLGKQLSSGGGGMVGEKGKGRLQKKKKSFYGCSSCGRERTRNVLPMI